MITADGKTAADLYAARFNQIQDAIVRLQGQLEIHRRRAAARPGDWGFAGDLERISTGLHEITPDHMNRRCEWKHPKTCGEYAAYCTPTGMLVCGLHAPQTDNDPSECLDLQTGRPADD